MSLRFGLFVPQGWRLDLVEIPDPVEKYETMTRVAREAERAGFDSVWLYDHFHTIPTAERETTFECWMSTAGLARDTSRIKIGQMVTCAGYRQPSLLAKMASTVDVMSNGRLLFGLGAGWYEQEWQAYGYDYPDLADRMGAFSEACEIIYRMWTEERPVFTGRYYSIDGPINEPKGVQQPHPSFWIGGSGERVTLRLVARYGDACNVDGDPATLRHKFAVLRRHCEHFGREYADITRSATVLLYLLAPGENVERAVERARGLMTVEEYRRDVLVATAEQAVEHIQALIDAGVTYVIVNLQRVAYDPSLVQRFATEVMPHLTV